MRSVTSVLLGALTTWSLVGGPASAQSAQAARPEEPAERFAEAISITEVEIPVTVLAEGEPVRGLTAEDFRVFDQGEPAELVGFRVVDVERPADGWGRALGGVGVPAFGDGRGGGLPLDDVAARIIDPNPFALSAGVVSAEIAGQVEAQTDQLSEIATLLRDVPGPKHMLLLTRGFPSGYIYSRSPPPERPLILRHLQGMFEALQRGGWILHVFDAEGIESAFAVEGLEGPPGGGSNADALQYVASEAGGLLFTNFNRLPDANERLLLKTSVTYVLTIRAPEGLPTDGRMRRLEVRLADPPPGTRIHHRAGYYTPRPTAERSPLERRLDGVDLILGEDEIEGFPLGLRVEAPASTACGAWSATRHRTGSPSRPRSWRSGA